MYELLNPLCNGSLVNPCDAKYGINSLGFNVHIFTLKFIFVSTCVSALYMIKFMFALVTLMCLQMPWLPSGTGSSVVIFL